LRTTTRSNQAVRQGGKLGSVGTKDGQNKTKEQWTRDPENGMACTLQRADSSCRSYSCTLDRMLKPPNRLMCIWLESCVEVASLFIHNTLVRGSFVEGPCTHSMGENDLHSGPTSPACHKSRSGGGKGGGLAGRVAEFVQRKNPQMVVQIVTCPPSQESGHSTVFA